MGKDKKKTLTISSNLKKKIDTSNIQFHFILEGKSTFVFNDGAYKMSVENGKYIVTGFMKMRGITKNITLHGKRIKIINNEMVFSAESLIDRQEFGISWNRPFQKIAGMMVSNEVKILLNVKLKEV